jgi:phenylacetate 2-hydroxylase
MVSPIISAAVLFVFYALWRWANSTDKPKIEGIPEIPGYPIFGSLYELGTLHCKVAQNWAKKYGPVFQVKLGHKVRSLISASQESREEC